MECNLKNLVKTSRKIFKKLDDAKGADLIVLIGNTGCGKSTLLSSLIFGPDKLHETQIDNLVDVGGKKIKKKLKVIDMKDLS